MPEEKDQQVKDFSEKIGIIKKQNVLIAETIEIKRSNIKKEADTITSLEGYHRKHEYIMHMFTSVPIDKVGAMTENEYSNFSSIVTSSGVSGEASYSLHDETRQAASFYQQHFATAASLNTMASADSTSVEVISLANPDWFPDGERITREFEIKDEIETQIKNVSNQLQTQLPDLKEDFDLFIKKFQVFRGDKSQYQDLIGSRSLLFFKMIFEFSKQTYGIEYPRLDAIKKFVFGSATVVTMTEPLLRASNDLYREMSGQDSSGMSIKVGETTPGYIEGLFRRLIGNMAAILDLRNQYFQQ